MIMTSMPPCHLVRNPERNRRWVVVVAVQGHPYCTLRSLASVHQPVQSPPAPTTAPTLCAAACSCFPNAALTAPTVRASSRWIGSTWYGSICRTQPDTGRGKVNKHNGRDYQTGSTSWACACTMLQHGFHNRSTHVLRPPDVGQAGGGNQPSAAPVDAPASQRDAVRGLGIGLQRVAAVVPRAAERAAGRARGSVDGWTGIRAGAVRTFRTLTQ